MDKPSGNFFNKSSADYISIFRNILANANKGLPRIDFMKRIINILFEFCLCDNIEIRLISHDSLIHCNKSVNNDVFNIDSTPIKRNGKEINISLKNNDSDLELLLNDIICGRIDSSLPYFTPGRKIFGWMIIVDHWN